MGIFTPYAVVVSDEEKGDRDDTDSLNYLPSDYVGTIELDFTLTSIKDDVARYNPFWFPSISTFDADDSDDVTLSRHRKIAPTASQGQSSKIISKKS